MTRQHCLVVNSNKRILHFYFGGVGRWWEDVTVVGVISGASLSELRGVLSHRTTRTALSLVLRRRSCNWAFASPLPAYFAEARARSLPPSRCGMNHPVCMLLLIALSAGYGGRRKRITRLILRTLDSLPPTFRSSLATLGPPPHRLARSVEDSLTRSATGGSARRLAIHATGRGLARTAQAWSASSQAPRSMPPAGFIRRTSW